MYVFVNLTAVLWLGALAINTIAGVDMIYGMMFLGVFSLAYSLYGGLKAVAMTDIIQVVLLVAGVYFCPIRRSTLLAMARVLYKALFI